MKRKTKKFLRKVYIKSKPVAKAVNRQIKNRVNAIARQQREYMKTGYDPYSTRF